MRESIFDLISLFLLYPEGVKDDLRGFPSGWRYTIRLTQVAFNQVRVAIVEHQVLDFVLLDKDFNVSDNAKFIQALRLQTR